MKNSLVRLRAALAACLIAVTAAAIAETPAGVPILPDTYGTVVIGDIPGLLDKIGALASKVVPGMNADVIKQQAGAMIGDPQLAGLPAGSGVAVVIPKQGLPYGYLEVSAEKSADYQKLLKQRNVGAVADAEGLLVVAANEAGLAGAKETAAKIKSDVLAGNGSPTLKAAVKLADVLKAYDPQIQAGIQQMAQKVEKAEGSTSAPAVNSSESIVTIFRAYYAVAKMVDTLELSLEPSADGMLIHKDITPVNKQTAAAVEGAKAPAELLKLLPGDGAIRGDATFDIAAMGKLMIDIIKEASGKSDSAVNEKVLSDWFGQLSNTFAGPMAMEFMGNENAPISGAYAIAVKDEAGALKFLQELPQQLEASGFTKLYASMGMPFTMTFKEKVREHAGVPIHQLTMKMDFKNAPQAQREAMEKLLGNLVYDVAVVDKVLLYAIQPVKVEDLIDAAKSGSNPAAKPLVSEEKLEKGGRGYFDYNIGAAMAMASAMAAGQQNSGAEAMKQMSETVKNAPPLQIAWYDQGTKYRFSMMLPAETLSAFVQAGQQISASQKAKSSSMDKESNEPSEKKSESSSEGGEKKASSTKSGSKSGAKASGSSSKSSKQ